MQHAACRHVTDSKCAKARFPCRQTKTAALRAGPGLSQGCRQVAAGCTALTLMHPPAAAGSTVFIWWASREEVPYTHRKHSILVPQWVEQQMGEQTFQQVPQHAGAAALPEALLETLLAPSSCLHGRQHTAPATLHGAVLVTWWDKSPCTGCPSYRCGRMHPPGCPGPLLCASLRGMHPALWGLKGPPPAWLQITTMAAAEGRLLPALHPATLLVEKTGRKVAKAAQEPPEDGRGYIEHMKVLVCCVPVANDAEVAVEVDRELPGDKRRQETSSTSTQLAPEATCPGTGPGRPHTADAAIGAPVSGLRLCMRDAPPQCWCSREQAVVILEPSAALQSKTPISGMLLQGLKWEFAVIDKVDPNAFVVPGEPAVGTTLYTPTSGPACYRIFPLLP